ncbi:MAG TPA: type II toxin-antitoxin system PemK/MazF family toxin [Burkholderiales bacterium]|nr:type II toxin-antitoxin system PemK/MazF family toxin [Burkholderiales bacterium]
MQRGEVWVANLNTGAGVGNIQPVVIFQENRVTVAGLPTVIVLPLTSQLREGLEPLRVAVRARDRLTKDCHVMVEQIRAIDRARIADGPLTKLNLDEMRALERSLRGVLGM